MRRKVKASQDAGDEDIIKSDEVAEAETKSKGSTSRKRSVSKRPVEKEAKPIDPPKKTSCSQTLFKFLIFLVPLVAAVYIKNPVIIYQDLQSLILNQETRIAELEEEQRLAAIKPVTNYLVNMTVLPTSSVYCDGEDLLNRACVIQNLCYFPKQDAFIVIRDGRSVIDGVPEKRSKLLYLTSIYGGHTSFEWDFTEISPYDERFHDLKVRYEEKTTLITSRFHPGNIMHSLHDDAMSYFWLFKKFGDPPREGSTGPFSTDNKLLFLEGHQISDATFLFKFLTDNDILFRTYLQDDPDVVKCFKRAIVGNSKRTSWYQYGFSSPQGPIPEKNVSGYHVREFSDYMIDRSIQHYRSGKIHLMNSNPKDVETNILFNLFKQKHSGYESDDLIVVLSRSENRLILNEEELKNRLEEKFRLRTLYLRMESHPIEEQIDVMRRAKIVVGMHGSILSMIMFCRPGAIVVEMFPYAVPSVNYTPYKTVAEMDGMDLVYFAWENKHLENNIMHPENSPSHGGLDHLAPEERQQILETTTVPPHLCCTNPYWLFRIYQDTFVDIDEIENLIVSGLQRSKILESKTGMPMLRPAPIEYVHFELTKENGNSSEVTIFWPSPWNLPSPGPSHYIVWILNTGVHIKTRSRQIVIKNLTVGDSLFVRIRSIVDGVLGPWGRKVQSKVGDPPGPGGIHLKDTPEDY